MFDLLMYNNSSFGIYFLIAGIVLSLHIGFSIYKKGQVVCTLDPRPTMLIIFNVFTQMILNILFIVLYLMADSFYIILGIAQLFVLAIEYQIANSMLQSYKNIYFSSKYEDSRG